MATAPTRVLVIDDSAVVRKLLGDALRLEPGVEVVGGAADPYAAREMIMRLRPDFLTLDIEMPRMDGLTFLSKLMASHPLPTIVVSSLTQTGSQASLEALRLGAIDVIAKPGGPTAVAELGEQLRQRLRMFRSGPPPRLDRSVVAPASRPARDLPRLTRGLFVIGASTGGTQAIETVLSRLPADLPPIVIVQHMPPVYTRLFAERMNSSCALRVVESAGGEVLQRGTVYIAPGGYHLTLEASGVQVRTALDQEPPIHFQRPAVDALFASACRLRGVPIVAVLLTGMGSDGAEGMVMLRKAGATTIAEAEESCVVFGMPREAIVRGGAVHVASLLEVPARMLEAMAALLQPPVGKHDDAWSPAVASLPEDLNLAIQSLTPLSPTAQRMLTFLRGEDTNMALLAELVEFDPVIAADALREASTARYSAYGTPGSVREAVVRLGFTSLLGLVLDRYMGQLRTNAPMYDLGEDDLWAHAAAAQLAVRALRDRDSGLAVPPMAETAALLHDIGKLVIVRRRTVPAARLRYRSRAEGIDFLAAERAVLGVDHTEVGAALANHWRLPEAIALAIRWHHDPGEVQSPIVDAVAIANVAAKTVEAGLGAEGLDLRVDRACFKRLGIGFDAFGEICLSTQVELAALRQRLGTHS